MNFEDYGKRFLSKVFYNEAQDEFDRLESMKGLTRYQRDQMAKVYAELSAACSAGKVVDIRENAMKKTGYKMWMEEGYQSILSQYLEWITADGIRDYNVLNAE